MSNNGRLKKQEYPFKRITQETNEEEEEGTTTDANICLAQISFQINPDMFIQQDFARIMYWNSELGKWANDQIEDTEIDMAKGMVKFKTGHFKPTAIVQVA